MVEHREHWETGNYTVQRTNELKPESALHVALLIESLHRINQISNARLILRAEVYGKANNMRVGLKFADRNSMGDAQKTRIKKALQEAKDAAMGDNVGLSCFSITDEDGKQRKNNKNIPLNLIGSVDFTKPSQP